MMKKKAFYWAFSLFAVSLISCNQEIDESIKKIRVRCCSEYKIFEYSKRRHLGSEL